MKQYFPFEHPIILESRFSFIPFVILIPLKFSLNSPHSIITTQKIINLKCLFELVIKLLLPIARLIIKAVSH